MQFVACYCSRASEYSTHLGKVLSLRMRAPQTTSATGRPTSERRCMAGEDTKPFVFEWGNGIFCSHTEVGEKAIQNGGKEHLFGSLFPRGNASLFCWARLAEGQHLCLGFNCVPDWLILLALCTHHRIYHQTPSCTWYSKPRVGASLGQWADYRKS